MASSLWSDIALLHVPLLEKIVRPVIVYVCLVVLLRIFGKRELAQLNPFDLVVLLSLSNTVQNAIIGEDNSVTGGIIGAISLLGINYLVVRFVLRHRRIDQILEGEPTVLVRDGKLIPRALAKEMLSKAEVIAVLHRQGFARLDEVERCVLEPGGVFYIQRKEPPAEDTRHAEVMSRLGEIAQRLSAIEGRAGGA